jgi:uncharacterized protein
LIGPIVNCGAVLVGSASGAFLGNRISENLRTRLPLLFGLSSLGLGVAMIGKVSYFPAVVLALLLGTILGELLHLEAWLIRVATRTRGFIDTFAEPADANLSHEEHSEKFVALMVLFCASATGIFGAMNEGMTGDTSLLIVKSILDFFTAAIFATALGYSLGTLAIPQLIIQGGLFFLASRLLPLITPSMVGDFSACGGLIMVATGFRMAGIKQFHTANMVPALFIAMPISALWARVMG